MTTYEIDGKNFSTVEDFYDEISRVLIPGTEGAGTSTCSKTSCEADSGRLLKVSLSGGRTTVFRARGSATPRLFFSSSCG